MTSTFTATLELNGKSATGIEVPAHVLAALGGKRPKVRATINGYTWATSVGSMGGRSMLPVNAEVRAGAGIAAGDDVSVALEPDDAPREVAVPDDLAAALAADDAATTFWGTLSYSHQRQYTLWIEGAKKAETRAGRVEKAVGMLREGRRYS